MESFNFGRVEDEYVHGSESYAALAARLGVEPKALARAGRELGWYAKRIQARQAASPRAEPMDILRTAVFSLCRCAGQAAQALENRDEPPGKGDLKSLHEAASLVKDLVGLVQNLYGEEKNSEVRICMEGEVNGFCN